jgi:hypothetical protein
MAMPPKKRMKVMIEIGSFKVIEALWHSIQIRLFAGRTWIGAPNLFSVK